MTGSPSPDATGGPLVTVIVPTYDHADTIDLACRSVLAQSVASLELVVIGDGATAAVRAALEPLGDDGRVRFLPCPKSASRAERVRHEVLVATRSTYIAYHGDDDLMLPGHLATTVARLRDVDFTHPLPLWVAPGGQIEVHATDLADPRCREWHQHPERNAVSLTGVGHRRDAYLGLPHGWREPPPGRWSDHYMWQQWFAQPGLRYSTGDTATVIKFDAFHRRHMSGPERRSELQVWLERSRAPGFDAWLAEQAALAFRRAAVELRLDRDALRDQLAAAGAATAPGAAPSR